MAFNLEDHIPKGYIKETSIIGDATVTSYRNPNPDPERQRQGLQEFMQELLPGYLRTLSKQGRT